MTRRTAAHPVPAPGPPALTPKQKAFVVAYLGPAFLNATEAAAQAGLGKRRASCATAGWAMLRNPEIQKLIRRKLIAHEHRVDLSNEELDRILGGFVNDPLVPYGIRVRAAETLARIRGLGTVNVKLGGGLTLEQALGEATRATGGR
jgi:hypothetical protein